MTHYADLSPCDYFGPTDGRLLAIGWLDREQSFRKGEAPCEHFESLFHLLTNAWQPFAFAGRHPCPFCVFTGGAAEVQLRDVSVVVGSTNLFVPADECVYVAPSLVLHYIDAHEYLPPDEFQRAVLACPPMRSIEYLKAITSATASIGWGAEHGPAHDHVRRSSREGRLAPRQVGKRDSRRCRRARSAHDYEAIRMDLGKRYIETRELKDAIGGNGPIVILAATGEAIALGTALRPEEEIARFEHEQGLTG